MNRLPLLIGLTWLLAAVALWISATIDHVHVVADQPIPFVAELTMPAWIHRHALPLALAGFAFLIWRTAGGQAGFALMSQGLVFLLLGLIWLQNLVRHEPVLSMWHVLLLTLVIWLMLARMTHRTRMPVVGAAAVVMTLLSYGAVEGETRCDEPGAVGCLYDVGPRFWVPRLLAGAGLPPFADLRGAMLVGVDLSERELRYADLRGADLRGANLADVNLRRARLDGIQADASTWQHAYLDGASMRDAHLTGSNLQGIHAYRVDFRDADLANADASGSSLSHAYLTRTNLAGLRLDNAYLRFTEGLAQSQLSRACGNGRTRLPPDLVVPACHENTAANVAE
jgi:hypothetical protein